MKILRCFIAVLAALGAVAAIATFTRWAGAEVDWDEPTDRIHRAVNVGEGPYEEITVFLMDRPDAIPQPTDS